MRVRTPTALPSRTGIVPFPQRQVGANGGSKPTHTFWMKPLKRAVTQSVRRGSAGNGGGVAKAISDNAPSLLDPQHHEQIMKAKSLRFVSTGAAQFGLASILALGPLHAAAAPPELPSGIITTVPAKGVDLSAADQRLHKIESIEAGITAVRSQFGELADRVAKAAENHAKSPSQDTANAYLEATADAALRGAKTAGGAAEFADAGATVLDEQTEAIAQGIAVLSGSVARAATKSAQLRGLKATSDKALGTMFEKLASANDLAPAQALVLRNALHSARIADRLNRSGEWSEGEIRVALDGLEESKQRQIDRAAELRGFAKRTRMTAGALTFEADNIRGVAAALKYHGEVQAMDIAGGGLVEKFTSLDDDMQRLVTNGLPAGPLGRKSSPPASGLPSSTGLLDQIRQWFGAKTSATPLQP